MILDEIHLAKDAGPLLKYLADTGHLLWITGSSEALLSAGVLAHLVGRVTVLRLYPFDLNEFLVARGQSHLTKGTLHDLTREYALIGGYPQVILSEGAGLRRQILKDLYDTTLLRDIALGFGLADIATLDRIMRLVAARPGAALNQQELANDARTTVPTLRKYLDALIRGHLLVAVRPFHTNRRKELVRQARMYHLDTGLANNVRDSRDSLDGPVFENYVMSELLKAGHAPQYWRTAAGAEVDFIIVPSAPGPDRGQDEAKAKYRSGFTLLHHRLCAEGGLHRPSGGEAATNGSERPRFASGMCSRCSRRPPSKRRSGSAPSKQGSIASRR